MNKILLENRLPQVLPILITDAGSSKALVQSHILSRGRKLILPTEMSRHISSLANKGYIRITYMKGVEIPERGAETTAPPPKLSSEPKPTVPSSKKRSHKKGRR